MKNGIFLQAFKKTPIGLFILNNKQQVQHWNNWLAEKTHITEEKAIGHTLEELFPHIKSARFNWAIEQCIENKSQQILSQSLNHYLIPIELEYSHHHDLKLMQQHVQISPIEIEGENLALISIIDVTENVFRDMSLSDMAKQLKEDSIRDALTGAHNRRFLWGWLNQQISLAYSSNYSISCLMVDIDHFKKINDEHGHDIGDKALKLFTETLQAALRKGDLLIRYGGEEFVILLPTCEKEPALKFAERLRTACKENTQKNSPNIQLSCCIGVSTWNYKRNPCSADDLIKQADEQMYIAKNNGRDQVQPEK